MKAVAKKRNSRAPHNVKPKRILKPRQQSFVEQYLVDMNGTKAVIRAGYSEKGADVQAARLLGNVRIATAIQKARNARSQRVEISQDRTIQEIARGCFWDVANMFNEDGSLKEIRELDYNTRMAIAGFEVVTLYHGEGEQKHTYGRLNKIKLVDRRDYLELLGRHQGLFKNELMMKHEFTAELMRIVGGGIDFSKITDKELEEFNARIAALVSARSS
ncbi:MAG: terminase small subunit [Terriglobia bacterium]